MIHDDQVLLLHTAYLPTPITLNYTFLSNILVRLEWSLVDGAERYLITSFNANGTDYSIIDTNDTSITIEYYEGMNVTVHSINECHMKSTLMSKLIQMSEASKYTVRRCSCSE